MTKEREDGTGTGEPLPPMALGAGMDAETKTQPKAEQTSKSQPQPPQPKPQQYNTLRPQQQFNNQSQNLPAQQRPQQQEHQQSGGAKLPSLKEVGIGAGIAVGFTILCAICPPLAFAAALGALAAVAIKVGQSMSNTPLLNNSNREISERKEKSTETKDLFKDLLKGESVEHSGRIAKGHEEKFLKELMDKSDYKSMTPQAQEKFLSEMQKGMNDAKASAKLGSGQKFDLVEPDTQTALRDLAAGVIKKNPEMQTPENKKWAEGREEKAAARTSKEIDKEILAEHTEKVFEDLGLIPKKEQEKPEIISQSAARFFGIEEKTTLTPPIALKTPTVENAEHAANKTEERVSGKDSAVEKAAEKAKDAGTKEESSEKASSPTPLSKEKNGEKDKER